MFVSEDKKNRIQSIQPENITKLNAEWLFVLATSQAEDETKKDSSRFCSNVLYVHQGFIFLPEDATYSEILAMKPHVSSICSSRYFLLVWEVITLKKQKSMPQCQKEILLKKSDFIIDVISV